MKPIPGTDVYHRVMRRLFSFAIVFGACSTAVFAQTKTQSPPPCELGQDSTTEKPCTPISAAERFKFPGDTPATPEAPSVNAPASANSPDAPLPQAPNAPAAKRSPYSPESDSTSSSSSSSGDSSSSAAANADQPPADDDKPVPPKLQDKGSNGKKKAEKVQTADERVTEDIQVANFYRNDGNFAGAYLRVKDAFATEPDDWEVNLTYAEVAMKLGKKDEALEHYQAYVKLDPKGKKVPEAEKIIQQLGNEKK